ncbi:MAG TPA: imelysin family protein, partial [Polyangiaceae bacterium]
MNQRPLSCVAVLCVCAGLLACGNTGAPPQNYGISLQYLTEQVILPEHQDFATKSDALVVTVQALADNADADSLTAAQGAWRDARAAFRVLDSLQIGPGRTLHVADRIDVSPVDAAGIEAIVTGTAAVDDHAVAIAGGKKKGFLGLEYLLFSDPTGPADTQAPALADDDAAARRRALALSIADEIKSSAHQLDLAWEPSGGNYAQQIELAGAGGTVYATQRAAVDDLVGGGVAGALEVIVGVRLALPLGLKVGGTPDPTADPTSRSDSAVADMQATLAGVAALYQGDGFSAVVKGKNAKLDAGVLKEISDFQAALSAIPAPFADALVNDTQKVEDAYEAGKALKATWNTDVSSALGATLKPADIDGD